MDKNQTSIMPYHSPEHRKELGRPELQDRAIRAAVVNGQVGGNRDIGNHSGESEVSRPLRDYWRIVFKYRWLIFSISAIVFVLTALYSFLATPLYSAKAVLRVSSFSPSLQGGNIEELLRQESKEGHYLTTQAARLKSLSMADTVLSNPDIGPNILEYFDRRTSFVSVFSPFTSILGEKKKTEAVEGLAYAYPLDTLNEYLGLIDVSPVRKTTLIEISVTTSRPELSASIANKHSLAFIEKVRADRQKNTLENLVFLKNQAEELATKVSLAERNLASYAEQNAIVSLNKDENIVVKSMGELNQMLNIAVGERIKAETIYKEAQKGSGLSSAAFDSGSMRELRVALKQAEAEYASLSKKFKPSYPKMVQIRAQISALKENLENQKKDSVTALKSTYEAALASEKELREKLEVNKSEAFELSRREVQYNIMKREFESLKDLHQSVLRQLKEAQLASESSGTNISVADQAAVPSSRTSPKRGFNMLVALFLGPCFGMILAFLLEALDNTLRTPDDVQVELQVPALGVVPVFDMEDKAEEFEKDSDALAIQEDAGKGESSDAEASPSLPELKKNLPLTPTAGRRNKDLVAHNTPRSVASEAFRVIRTGILLSSADRPPKTVLVTSAKKGEGKTTLASNLATTMAQSGYKTVLVDADLRRPAVYKVFGVENTGQDGLVEAITGHKEIRDCIVETGVENLSLITSGDFPPNPAELIGSRKMADILSELSDMFDFILLDAPPVLPVTDAIVLSRIVDGVVMVVRGQDTQTQVARSAANRLKSVDAKILGVVLNSVDVRGGDYYYYYRDTYSYHYQEKEKEKRRFLDRKVAF